MRSFNFIITLLFGLSSGEVLPGIRDLLFSGRFEFLDLSHPIDNSTIYWPGQKKFEFTKKSAGNRPNGKWYSANEFCAAEHGGTHLDAPYHFNSDGWTVGQIPFGHLITPLYVVDVSQLVKGNNDFVLQKHHMDNLFVGDMKHNFTVIFRFGWSQYYSDKTKYLGTSKENLENLNFPGISEDVAKWISEHKNLVGVGVDTASVDPGSNQDAPAHVALAKKNIFHLENVNIPKVLPSNKCAIVVMPMKIQDGTGAPCRITAICPRFSLDSLF